MSEKPVKYWRADGGFQDAPQQSPVAAMYNWQCWPNYGPWWCQQQQPQGYVNGPIPLGGLWSPPPPYGQPPGYGQPPAYGDLSPPPPPPPAPAQEDKKKNDKKKDKKKENANFPPKLHKGEIYMYDKHHTMVHIFNKAAPVWEKKYRTETLKFKMFRTSVNFSVKMIIENVTGKEGDDCKEFAVTEAVERGNGAWDEGTTINYDSDKADGKLKDMGWSVKRGDALPPVWLVVHKIDFK